VILQNEGTVESTWKERFYQSI